MLYFLLRLAEKNGKGSNSARMAEILSGPPLPAFHPPITAHFERSLVLDDKPQAEYWKQYQELKTSRVKGEF
jgi:hypothetical protein